jgi:hypothetical protein
MEMQTKLITTLWVLWSEQNSVNAGERVSPADKTGFQIMRHISEFKNLCSDQKDRPVKQLEKWKKPDGDDLKINIDGAFFQNSKTSGWGFIIRDSNSDHVGSGVGHIAAVAGATYAEAHACLQAVQFAIDAGIDCSDPPPHRHRSAKNETRNTRKNTRIWWVVFTTTSFWFFLLIYRREHDATPRLFHLAMNAAMNRGHAHNCHSSHAHHAIKQLTMDGSRTCPGSSVYLLS